MEKAQECALLNVAIDLSFRDSTAKKLRLRIERNIWQFLEEEEVNQLFPTVLLQIEWVFLGVHPTRSNRIGPSSQSGSSFVRM